MEDDWFYWTNKIDDSAKVTTGSTKQSILDAAWSRYSVNYHKVTLGSCIRAECPVSYQEKFKVLSRLDGACALELFNDTYEEK
jgi:hypothetical protein